ncbi:MAG TPA: hypothetical protein VKP58_05100 [Candidatus Acidoferrum sp.]|nr:hypothetical protein [Candidatus Acidoferrum sp.]
MPTPFEYLSSDYLGNWKPVSKLAGISWLVFYALFLLYAALNAPNFLILDFANLAIHEAGHALFSPFGYTLTILGGTLAELIAPFACFSYFFAKRETTGVAFCAFWFFENFLYIGTYMADARALSLPLVGSGDHDWQILFTQWNLLLHDVQIGHTTRLLGWLGMLATLAWLAYRTFHAQREPD